MSTHSFIGKENTDGSIRAIYCHFDGYPEHVGNVLKEHYTAGEKVDELLDLGDLSYLAPYVEPQPELPHSFDGNHQRDVCLAYGRDRGEKGVEAKNYKNRRDFINGGSHMGASYWYLHHNGTWKTLRRGEEYGELPQ